MRITEITVEAYGKFEEIVKQLLGKGFKVNSKYQLVDIYYSKYSREELNKLSYAELIKNSFMLREIIENGEASTFLQFKDKMVDEKGQVVSEEKIKCKVENLETAKKVFKRACVDYWCELNQNIVDLNKDGMMVSVQEVDDLGLFIECEEDESLAEMTEQQKMKTMIDRLKSLGLNIGDDFSCKKVYMKYMK